MKRPNVERTGSDDPLVNRLVQFRQIPKEGYQQQELEELKCEKSVGLSHVEDGGGDAQQLAEENVNSYEEWKRSMCERSTGPSHVEDGGGDAHQLKQSNHWLFREQLEISQHESAFEIKRREQKVRLPDLKHYSSQEWRFTRIVHQVRLRDLKSSIWIQEEFWISVYGGSYHPDYDMLEWRGWALSEYLFLRDEEKEKSPQVGVEQWADLGTQQTPRSSAVTGMADLAGE
jgi:hypothetical protein